MPLSYDMGPMLYFPSEGRRAEDFFALKIRRVRPGANPRTWVPKASTLLLDHRSRKVNTTFETCLLALVALSACHYINLL